MIYPCLEIGLTVSKFQMAENTTALDSFRDGSFALALDEIGAYRAATAAAAGGAAAEWLAAEELPAIARVAPLSSKEAAARRPLALKVTGARGAREGENGARRRGWTV